MSSISDTVFIHDPQKSSNINRRNKCRRLSDKMFRCLVEAMNEGVILINNAGIIIYVNNKFCNMLGYSSSEITGKTAVDFIEKTSRAGLKEKITHCIEIANNPKTTRNTSLELSWKSKDKTTIFSQISPQIISNCEQQTNLFFAVVTDITKSKKVKESLIQSKRESHHLSEKLLTAQEIERKRVAEELHDGIGQCLSAIKYKIEELVAKTGDSYSDFEPLNVLIPLLQNATAEVTRIAMALRPSILDDLGLKATISWLAREFHSIYPNIQLETCIGIEEEELSTELKTVLYRVIQESINNIAKHAKATNILIQLNHKNQQLELSISDNGIGLPAMDERENMADNIGLGLSSMKKRVEIASGIFTIESTPNRGTKIIANWAWKPPATQIQYSSKKTD